MSSKILGKISLVAVMVIAFSLVVMSPAKAFYIEVPQLIKNARAIFQDLPVLAQEGNIYQDQAPALDNQAVNQEQQPPYQGPEGNGEQNLGPGPNGPNEQERQKQQKRQLQDIKRGSRQMESQLKKFESMMKSYASKGITVTQEITDKVARIKEILAKIKTANSMEEMAAATMNEETGENELETMQEMMQNLEQTRQEVFEAAQRLDGLKRNIKGMAQGIKMFEKQIASLTKKKIAIPVQTTETLAKIKAMIEIIKNAKTWDEVETAGVEEMQDLMMALDESRQQLEMLVRWPQTLKQMERELKNLATQLKRTKSMVTKLQKKEIDVSANYEQFSSAIDRLKAVRDEAAAKIAAGESQDAFDLVENDFFSQMEDVWQNQRIIETMSNLGRFMSDYKRGLAQAQQVIKIMERKKVDMSEAKDLLAQAKAQGETVVSLIKAKPVDADAVLAALEDFENIMQEFGNKMEELGAGPPPGQMPWEQGPPQFQEIKMSPGMNQYLPARPTQPQQPIETMPNNGPMGPGPESNGNTGPTCNINGVEMPGPCSNYEGI